MDWLYADDILCIAPILVLGAMLGIGLLIEFVRRLKKKNGSKRGSIYKAYNNDFNKPWEK